ncbi:MAG: Gfo/Idh/MocA family oxidoreductase [Clostridia bacterium]|nr:Gfo/Idh/MocA family oxidoreductase [Clostridia bacterium]
MKKIKIAQIGMAHDHAGVTFSALSKIDDFDVVGYCTVPEDESEYASQQQKIKSNEEYFKNAKRYTVEEILSMPDLDAVVIETFDLNLVKYAKMAAERGLHVQMDKAPGESAKEYEELLSIIKSKNLAFSIGYMYRFNPFIKSVYEKVFSGEIGKVHTVDAEMSCYMNTNKRIWLEQFKGGMMQFLGCHLVDLVVQLMGVPTEIIPYNFSTGANNVDSLDVAFSVFKYKNALATIKSSVIDCGGYVRRHLTISTNNKTIDIRPLEKLEVAPSIISTKMTEYCHEKGWHDLGITSDTGAFDRYEAMLLNFAKMIRGEVGYVIDLETEARIHRCLLSACGIDCDYKGEIKI